MSALRFPPTFVFYLSVLRPPSSVPLAVPIEVDARVDDLRLSAPTLVAECSEEPHAGKEATAPSKRELPQRPAVRSSSLCFELVATEG